jgi:hypothetical protein
MTYYAVAFGVLVLAGPGRVRLSVDGHDAAFYQLKCRETMRLFLLLPFQPLLDLFRLF